MNNHEFTKLWRNKNSTKCWSTYKFGLEIEMFGLKLKKIKEAFFWPKKFQNLY